MSSERIPELLARLERRRRLRQALGLLVLTAILVTTFLGLRFVSFDVLDILAQLDEEAEFVGGFFPPNFVDLSVYTVDRDVSGLDAVWATVTHPGTIAESLTSTENTLIRLSLVTLILGFTGTVLGFPLALTFGVLGSERVTPFPFNFLFRGVMSAIRAIPALVWILIYVPIAGITPISAVLAITTDTVGNLGRLFTDELEEISDGPIEAIRSTGASPAQVVSFGMLSQVSTSFIAWTLYIVEINVRIAISLGVVGAGGIGRYIRLRQDLFKYPKAAAGIIMVFVIVISVELVSTRIRARLRPGEHGGRSLVDIVRGLGDPGRWLGFGTDPKGD